MLCYRLLYLKMEDYPFSLMDSQVNSRFILDLSYFINELCKGDHINNFTTD